MFSFDNEVVLSFDVETTFERHILRLAAGNI
jgi:hypothetical protein